MIAEAEALIRAASLSPAEAAAELGISEASLRTAIARGLPTVSILRPDHRLTRILRSEVAERKKAA